MITANRRPDPFPELQVTRPCRVVGGSNLSRHAVVKLITGKNGTGSAKDGVPEGEFFNEEVVGVGTTAYPSTGLSGNGAVTLPFFGILQNATANGEVGQVTFRGAVFGITVACDASTTYPVGSLVILDSGSSYALRVVDALADTAAGDHVVGKLLSSFISGGSETSRSVDIYFNGIDAFTRFS